MIVKLDQNTKHAKWDMLYELQKYMHYMNCAPFRWHQ